MDPTARPPLAWPSAQAGQRPSAPLLNHLRWSSRVGRTTHGSPHAARAYPQLSRVDPLDIKHAEGKHGDVVILLVSGEHPAHKEADQGVRVVGYLLRCLRRHLDKLIETRVEAALAVLHQAVRVQHRRAAWFQAERVLQPGAGPAKRGAGFRLVQPRGVPGLK